MLLRRNFRPLSSLQRSRVSRTLYDDRSAERMRLRETELSKSSSLQFNQPLKISHLIHVESMGANTAHVMTWAFFAMVMSLNQRTWVFFGYEIRLDSPKISINCLISILNSKPTAKLVANSTVIAAQRSSVKMLLLIY
jgi:hypothetical protein